MHILLPPSEGKRVPRRGQPLDLDTLSFPALTDQREAVLAALVKTSAHPAAADLLGVSPGLQDAIDRNTTLRAAPSATAASIYDGVLDQCQQHKFKPMAWSPLAGGRLMDPANEAGQRLRKAAESLSGNATARILISSALFGVVRLTDRIPAYRLSMGVNLPGVGPLAGVWKGALTPVLDEALGGRVIIDCRSSTYANSWVPRGALADLWVKVHVPGATHMAKHTRGLVTRALVQVGRAPATPAAVARALAAEFDVSLAAPTRPGAGWVLSATAR